MDIHPRDESPVVIETGQHPMACVIWLHGLGADGHDFEGLVPELRLPAQLALRFVFPQAPFRPVTINGGYIMRAWYDIAMTEHGIEQNPEQIRESQEILQALIEEQMQRGIPGERIVLAGFSQGGAIALHTGLRYPKPLAGIMSLSAPVPFAENLMAEIHPANAAVPVFMEQRKAFRKTTTEVLGRLRPWIFAPTGGNAPVTLHGQVGGCGRRIGLAVRTGWPPLSQGRGVRRPGAAGGRPRRAPCHRARSVPRGCVGVHCRAVRCPSDVVSRA